MNVLLALPRKDDKFKLSSTNSKENLFINFWEEVRLPIATHQESFLKKSKPGAYKNYTSDKIMLDKVYKTLMSYHSDIKDESRGKFKKLCSSKKKVSTQLKSIQKSFTKAIKRFGKITVRNYDPWEINDFLENIVMDIDEMIAALKKLDSINNPKK